MKKFYKSIFSAVLLLCSLSVSLTACSHEGSETPEKPNTEDPSSGGTNPDTPQQKGDSILAQLVPTPAAESGQDLEGFLVGDKIYYDLKITDAKGPESSTYTLDLEGAGRVENHRQIGKDFVLFVAKVKADGSAKDWNEVKSFPYTLPSKGDYRLMYESKTDGTFDHKYQLKRQLKGKSDSKITNLPIVFYVLDVDIAYAVEKLVLDDRVRYLMGIKVKCGSLPTDKLLETFDPNFPKGRSYTFKLVYKGEDYTDSFQPNVYQRFYHSGYVLYDKRKGEPDLDYSSRDIEDLIITIKTAADAAPLKFRYKKLRVRRDDDWRRK
ncbi:hypothetical protein [Alloprevotella tannerae]|uniref:hypothetical protein n=1 Tax=Alloprevotella tannerae TaxID=76122 RepID=UPI0028E93D9E|nr:hypothetical protein [Alloprevotella tannerae]